jgi:hypothetical protein
MASEDLLSQSTVCNGIHGYHYSCVTFDNLTEDNEVYVILYYPLYSRWDCPEYPFLFKKPNQAACWEMSRFKQDGFGNVWGQGKYLQFLSFVSQVMMKRCEVQVALESLTTKSKIENCVFSQVIFHLPKKEPILLSSDYIQLSKKNFFQCTGGFHTNEPDCQQSANSIYQDQDRFSCQRMTINTINKKFNVTLHQKLAESSGFIQFEAQLKFMKDSPPKNYCKIIGCVKHSLHRMVNWSHHSYSDLFVQIIDSYCMGWVGRSHNRIIVSVGCGRAEMEMHCCDLHICLDIDKRALFCAKFATRYLFRKKGNIILQHYNMNEGLSHILTQIQEKLTTVELIVLFQHPNPSKKRIVCDVLIKGIMECLDMCFMEIVASVYFVYNWHPNKNCWNVNEVKTLIMDNSNIKLLGCLNILKDV